MEIYYYCSYKGSPVGFQLGKLKYPSGGSRLHALDAQGIPPLVQRCFDQNIVRKVCKRSAEEKEYILLAKGLTAKGKQPEDPAEYYINFALVTDSEADCQKWLRGDGASGLAIADAIRDTMELDRQSAFGFTVRGDKLDALLSMSYRKLFEDAAAKEHDGILLEAISPNTTAEQLQQALRLDALEGCRLNGNWFKFGKKKESRKAPLGILLAAAVIAALILLCQRFNR